MLCELATLSYSPPVLGQAAGGVEVWIGDTEAKGRLLGCWRTEIGTLGRMLVLRGFDAPEDMMRERRRALLGANPFDAGSQTAALEMESYAPFPFLPPIRMGDRGEVYEFRTYWLRPGGLRPTLAAWEASISPARAYTDHLVVTMYALDGPLRITHIWAFASLEERAALRGWAYGAGVWPPQGGPEQILHATSTIALPQERSPLH